MSANNDHCSGYDAEVKNEVKKGQKGDVKKTDLFFVCNYSGIKAEDG